ncbi:MAG: hypothetical protein KAT68_16060 [Bacteroidales bacterium]|nr:hypothetical protein [Bacteroidales bacterium]
MKCYLHIGTEKTATTTLKHFLHRNRDKLSQSGYGYTKSVGKIINLKLPIAAYDLNRRDAFTKGKQIYTNTALFKYQQAVITKLKKEINGISQPNIIFSSEQIQSRLTSLSEIKRLKEILINLGFDEIAVIIYLWDPSEIANSFYSTSVKSGSTEASPQNLKGPYFRNICNHKNTLENFGSVFGKIAIIPRICDKDEFKNVSIIEDFIDVIGAPWFDDYIIPNNLNDSISATGLEILRRFNQKVPVFIDAKINPLRQNIVHYFDLHYGKDKYMMPIQLQQEYDIEFKESALLI